MAIFLDFRHLFSFHYTNNFHLNQLTSHRGGCLVVIHLKMGPNIFQTREKEIASIAAIVTTIGVFFAAFGIFFAYCQLKEAKRSLEASTVYNIQKDGRELLNSLQKDVEVLNYIYRYDKNKQYDNDLLLRADLKITEIIQYFSSVFNQRKNKVITDLYWDTFVEEICRFIKKEPVSRFWKDKVIKGKYSNEFKTFGNNCLKKLG